MVFRIGFKTEIGFTNTVVPNQYWYFDPGNPTQNFIGDQRTREWGPVEQHENECLNYYARWCGDGLITNGETCDPAAPGYTPDTCSVTTCTPIAPPPVAGVCNSAVNGQTYPHTTTAYPVAQCTSGTPSVTTFPTPGNTVSWTCSGTNGGAVSPVCSASTLPVPVNGVCDPARTGVQPAPITAGACTTGSPTGFTAVGTNPANYAWDCTGNNGGSTASCTASYTPPVVPVCNPAKTGTQASPVSSTDTLCNVGTVSAFVPVTVGNKTTYTWSCNASSAVNCSADYTVVPPPPAALALKKYVSGQDAQDNATAVTVASPSAYNYTIIVTNVGSGALVASTTTVTDTLPTGVTLTAKPSGTGWTCTGDVGATSFSCTRADGLAAGVAFATITVPVTVTAAPGYITNTATVTNPSDSNGPTDNTDPAVIYIPAPTPFDLSIKKYISTGSGVELDAQSGSAVSMNTGSGFNYVIRVKNEGTGGTYGITTVKDILPAGVTLSGTIIGNGWLCTASGQTISCSMAILAASGVYLPDIIIPVRVTATTGTIVNNALVHNPNESNPCNTDGSMPAGDESACAKDPKNVDPAYIVVTPVGSPLLTIRKFAKGIDSQTQTGQVVIGSGEVYPYTFVVTNSGTAVALGARVVDTLPAGIEIIGTPTGTGWACTMSGQTMDCMYDTPIAIGATAPTITAQARIRATVAAGTSIRNVAAVCARDPSKPATDPANACVPDPVLCKIGDLNYNPVTQQCDPATVVLTGTGFDLSIKKYISTGATFENDAQIGSGVTLTSGLAMNYIIRVKNEGPQTTTGTTTVRDTLPTGVVGSGAVTGALWICTSSGADISCATTQVVASGSTFTDIIVPVRITAGASSTVTNYAVVYNPDELNPCKTDASMPVGNETTCTKDPKNIDPAQFTIPGGGSNGSIYYTPTCTNSVRSCSTVSASSQPVGSYTTLAECNTKNTIACGPGPGGSSGNPGRCGDGILGSSSGEECDLPGATWCGQAGTANACKIVLDTTPGANPISLKLKIPALGTVGSATFGTSIPVSAHRVVIG